MSEGSIRGGEDGQESGDQPGALNTTFTTTRLQSKFRKLVTLENLQKKGRYETKENLNKRKEERINVILPSKHKQKERDVVII